MEMFHGIAFGRGIPQDGFGCRRSSSLRRIVVLVVGCSWNHGHLWVKRDDTLPISAEATTTAASHGGGRRIVQTDSFRVLRLVLFLGFLFRLLGLFGWNNATGLVVVVVLAWLLFFT